jgi:hypothetical protein
MLRVFAAHKTLLLLRGGNKWRRGIKIGNLGHFDVDGPRLGRTGPCVHRRQPQQQKLQIHLALIDLQFRLLRRPAFSILDNGAISKRRGSG